MGKKRNDEHGVNSATTESTEQKLLRLASKRVPAAIKRIKYVGNLAAYKPTQDQAYRIVSALTEALTEVNSRFSGATKQETVFTL